MDELMCSGGLIPSRAINSIIRKGSEEAKRGVTVNLAPSGSGFESSPSILYGHSLKVELRSPKPSVWVQFLLPVLIIMAVWQRLQQQIVALVRGFDPHHCLFITAVLLGYSRW